MKDGQASKRARTHPTDPTESTRSMRAGWLEGLEDVRLLGDGGPRVGRLLDVGLVVFFGRLLFAIARHPRMLTPRYGRRHRLVGVAHMLYMLFGVIDARQSSPRLNLWYDAGLSVLGFATAYSAAADFGQAAVHRKKSHEASGILDEHATVHVGEMLEHCFYQLLNLAQVLYLHAVPTLAADRPLCRLGLALAMLAPWHWRGRFPVNAFSANYERPGVGGSSALIRFLYRMKKYQYLLYKHALLHGLNASVAVDGRALAATTHFRTYWLCLNIAYVMEFFMQTLVKRQYMSQRWMLALQQLLMTISTVYALQVLQAVHVLPALLSLGLNLRRRGRELSNGALVLAAAALLGGRAAVAGSPT